MQGFGTEVPDHNGYRFLPLAKEAGDVLEKHYPGWAWLVSIEHGFLNVFSYRLSPQWGFRILLTDLVTDPTLRTVVRAGGEVLERWRQARRRYQPGRDGLQDFLQRPELVGNEDGARRGKPLV